MDENKIVWDVVINSVCNSEEKQIMSNIPEHEYHDIECAYGDLLDEIKNKIHNYNVGQSKC